MNKNQFLKLSKDYTAIPVYKRLLADVLTPVSLFMNIREGARNPFLLESVEGGEQLARYSFIGRNPYQTLQFDGATTSLSNKTEKVEIERPYFEELKSQTTKYTEPKIPELPRLTGGAVGFSAYDTFRLVEDLPDVPDDDLHLPEAVWCFYDEIYAFDHVKHQVILIKTVFTDETSDPEKQYESALISLEEMESAAMSGNYKRREFSIDPESLVSNIERDQFKNMVNTAKDYIYEGDIFQVVLSQRFEANMSGDSFMLYRALRMVNPSPYLFFLDFDDFQIVGSSPEVLVRVQDKEVRVLPIAGTRPRGNTHQEDLDLEEDLKNDPKEVAEHIMLVDLGRNDLSRVSKPGTVKMERNQVIERYSHVMHIVSDVVGEISNEKTSVDALMQCFPAGTVSGAPKIRAMQIIDELEPTKRGIYAGAVGYFDFSGNMDTCIAIRTMVVTKNKVYIQAGAGIVADSDPSKEFEETQNKAGALVQALSVALDIE
ncbi:MAG TPA: anthranilate synthase component I [Balneola sp.]|jgi:anthranilate synthase component I|nr:anthranilate synthase component I [Balneola sp.]MAO78287.1 anthranilate synthase component I [Balneola sp.]MBF64288.1 anthranilate synthase component I [Balneola sp.]HBZ37219.1 anthranilate synthase component I [Balneola sp.]|tara:strand:+ start:11348 stop:12808 length:1461 start_codon:yes stop_codon:yes gene_type:complete